MHLLFGPHGLGWHGFRSGSTKIGVGIIQDENDLRYSLSVINWHCRNGSPVYPGKQVQEGKWLMTWQFAFEPQVPGHGSMHLLRTHALFAGQSELSVHSGRHPSYGLPMYSARQEQDPALFCILHMEFAPHGNGIQGFVFSIGDGAGIMLQEVKGSPV